MRGCAKVRIFASEKRNRHTFNIYTFKIVKVSYFSQASGRESGCLRFDYHQIIKYLNNECKYTKKKRIIRTFANSFNMFCEMTLQEAIKARHSVRAYKELPLAEDVVKVFEEQIAVLNREGKLHIQLILNEPKAFLGTMAKYGKFRNVGNYIVMVGKKADDLDERIGYYGEHLVLLAQTLGLNTCWVGLSYSKVPGTYVLNEGEKIACYIALGYGETQGVGHKIKTVEQVSNASDVTPLWFRMGVEAALLAPTAVNQQKFSFEYAGMKNSHHLVHAKKGFSIIGYTQMDLGIAKYHFEIGAGKEDFEWV